MKWLTRRWMTSRAGNDQLADRRWSSGWPVLIKSLTDVDLAANNRWSRGWQVLLLLMKVAWFKQRLPKKRKTLFIPSTLQPLMNTVTHWKYWPLPMVLNLPVSAKLKMNQTLVQRIFMKRLTLDTYWLQTTTPDRRSCFVIYVSIKVFDIICVIK